MSLSKSILRSCGLVTLSFVPVLGIAANDELPVADFAALPAVEYPVVSPDGAQIATIINGQEGAEIAISDFGGNPLQSIARFDFGHYDVDEIDRVTDLRWAGSDMLFISVIDVVANQANRTALNNDALDTVARNAVNTIGTGIRGRRMFVYKMETNVLSPVWRKSEKANIGAITPVLRDFGRIISYLPQEPDEILVEMYAPEDRAHSVFRVNIAKNEWNKELQNKYPIDQWIADPAGRIQFGIQRGPDTKTIWYSPGGKEKFKPIMSLPVADNETFEPLTANDGTAIVISDHETGFRSLWTYDLNAGEFGTRLFAVDGVDISSATLTDDASQVRSATYTDQYPTTEYFLDTDTQRSGLIAQSFRGYHASIASESRTGHQVLVSLHRDDVPLKYFWVDLAKSAAGPWYGAFPGLDGQAMANKQSIEYEAKDGMQLNGYLTVPERADGKKPPVVILPHDGPDSRDDMRFDPMVQFLANRGYAVLQPNYRGSRGFGTEYLTSGYREWGMAMQDDLVAAADWLDSVDSVDASNKCILGFRYAGYAAITAAYRRQMKIDCAIGIASPYDVYKVAFKEYRQRFDADDKRRFEFKPDHSSDANGTSVLKNFWDTTSVIGNPVERNDKEMMLANSPSENIEKLNVPLLIVHGSHDTYVDINQAKSFERTAGRANKAVEYVQLEYSSHFVNGHQDRIQMYEAIDKFLNKYLD
ncbi:MAG: alpha/beta hydrolase family protein [Woeseiaceae bacterium]